MTVRDYYHVTKPGIIYGNLFVAIGAFFLGAHWQIDWLHLIGMMFGLGLIIASGSVFNNYYDRDIDAAMARTKSRPSATGVISPRALIAYAGLLGLLGASILYILVNTESLAAALFGLISYDLLYTVLTKRGRFGTLVGSISGAMPPVVGYVAATGHFDLVALTLFLMLVFWQMPHAYAIALYRFDDYKVANVPVLPVLHGVRRTKLAMFVFVVLFTITAVHLTRLGAAGQVYGLIAALASLAWLALAIRGFYVSDWQRWGRRMFFASLIILMLLFVVMAIDTTIIR